MNTDIINPTRMELARLKREHEITQRGYKLLKDKQDELIRRFMQLVEQTKTIREEVDELLVLTVQKFNVATAKSNISTLYDSLILSAGDDNISYSSESIMSVIVPKIKYEATKKKELPYTFIQTPAALDKAVEMLTEFLPKLILLAELEKKVDLLSNEIEKTRRRVNAIEHIRLPSLEENIKRIIMKLDDIERFNTVRMMKSKEITTKKNK